MKKKFETIRTGEYEMVLDMGRVSCLDEYADIEELLGAVSLEWDEDVVEGCSGDYYTPPQDRVVYPINVRLNFGGEMILVPKGDLEEYLANLIYDKINDTF